MSDEYTLAIVGNGTGSVKIAKLTELPAINICIDELLLWGFKSFIFHKLDTSIGAIEKESDIVRCIDH